MILRCTCGKNLRVADEHAGKRIRCPACGDIFLARPASTAVTPAAAAPVPLPPRADAPASGGTADKSLTTVPQPAERARRSSSALLIASGGLGALALMGFLASGVLLVLGLNASPKNTPVVTPAAPAPQRPPPKKPNAGPPPPEKSKDEIRHIENVQVTSVALNGDGSQVLGAGGTGLTLWDLEKGTMLRHFPADKRGLAHALFLPDGKQALVSHVDGRVETRELETGKVVRPFAANVKPPMFVPLTLSADGRRVTACSRTEHFLRQWDAESGRETACTEELPAPVNRFSASAKGTRALLISEGLPFLWDVDKGPKVRRLSAPASVHFTLSPDGRRALFASGKRLLLWDVDRDEEIAHFEPSREPIYVAFSPDGRMALVAGSGIEWRENLLHPINGCFWLYDLERRAQVRQFDGFINNLLYLAFTPDGRRAVSYGNDRILRVWQLPSREVDPGK